MAPESSSSACSVFVVLFANVVEIGAGFTDGVVVGAGSSFRVCCRCWL